MYAFQAFLQSLFTTCVVLNEYTLIFDRWIITASVARAMDQRLSSSEVQKLRLLKALRTSVIYAILEPASAWLIMTFPGDAIFWFLWGAFLHAITILCVNRIKLEALLDVHKEHMEKCKGELPEDEARRSPDLIPNEDGERGNEKLLERKRNNDYRSLVDPTTRQHPLCAMQHKLGRAYFWSTYPPILTAALTNAGLILYCRYLTTADSRVWLENNPFGWTVIALTGTSLLGASKWENKMMHENTWRPQYPLQTLWDMGQVFGCLLVVFVVRTALRLLLFQSPLTPVAWSKSQSALIVQGYPLPRNVVTDADGVPLKEHKTLAWIGIASSICQIVGWSGYWGYWLYNRNRERRQRVQ